MTPSDLCGDPAELDDRFPLPLDAPFTSRQASREGVTKDQLTRLCDGGLLRRPVKGVYVAAQVPDSAHLRVQVATLVAPPGSVLADWSATWFWTGIDLPGAHLATPRLTVLRFRGHERIRNGFVGSGQRWFKPSDVVPLDGNLFVTKPVRTAWDLGRFSPPIVAIGGMDALARHGSFVVDELVDGVERFRRQRGVVQLRRLAPLVDPRAESTGESSLRWRWLEAPDLPPPEVQISIRDALGRELFRIDLGVEELRFGAEYDGEQWHTSPEDQAHDVQRRDTLEMRFGWDLEVFRREDVYGQHENATTRLVRGVGEARTTLRSRRRR